MTTSTQFDQEPPLRVKRARAPSKKQLTHPTLLHRNWALIPKLSLWRELKKLSVWLINNVLVNKAQPHLSRRHHYPSLDSESMPKPPAPYHLPNDQDMNPMLIIHHPISKSSPFHVSPVKYGKLKICTREGDLRRDLQSKRHSKRKKFFCLCSNLKSYTQVDALNRHKKTRWIEGYINNLTISSQDFLHCEVIYSLVTFSDVQFERRSCRLWTNSSNSGRRSITGNMILFPWAFSEVWGRMVATWI